MANDVASVPGGAFEKFKKGRFFGVSVLLVLTVVFWALFKLLSPSNFGTAHLMGDYLQTCIQYAVGGCGFYFIVVMGLFDFSIGANIVLSSLVGVLLSRTMGYFGLIAGCLLCGALIGAFNGFFYSKLRIPSMIVTVGLMLILESVANYVVGLDKSGFPGKLTNAKMLAFNGEFIIQSGEVIFVYFSLNECISEIGSSAGSLYSFGCSST